MKLCPERCERPFLNGQPDLLHELREVVQVMQRIETRSQHISDREQVVKIRARVSGAHRTTALSVNPLLISCVPGLLDQDATETREHPAAPSMPGRPDAVA